MKKKNRENPLEPQVLRFLSQHRDSSFSSKQLGKRLKIKKKDSKNFRRFLRDLAQRGEIVEMQGLFQWPGAAKKQSRKKQDHQQREEMTLEGTMQQYRGGFAFVLPVDKTKEDVFVPPGGMAGALHGDRVLVKIVKPQGQRKAEGQVIRVINRKTRTIVGIFETGKSYGRVIPWDKKLQVIPIVSTSHFLGATDGMIVEAELISDGSPPEAKIVSLLGFHGEPDIDAKIIISKYQLPREFPDEVLREANEVAIIRKEDYEGRKDFRQWDTVTIDGQKARDFDDAISLTTFKNGNFLLGVHIADVAHYVREHSPLDEEALERGNSVYFPDLVIPMLPEKLSNEICSLNPQVDRLTMSVVMRIDPNGELIDYHIYPSVINSNERMTYSAVKGIVEDHDPELLRRYEPLLDTFLSMKTLALLLMQKRRKRGSIDFDLPEPEIILDLTTGRMTGVVKAERNIAHRLIEEFMLLANEVVATHLSNAELPGMYRAHEPPPPERIMDFAAVAATLGHQLPADPKKIQPRDLQKLLAKVEGKPEERFINVLLLRSMARARYDAQNVGHFGLALDSYTHFTSPIRRYPDLVVHRILKAIVTDKKSAIQRVLKMGTEIPEIAEHCSITERRADDAEREFVQLKKVEFMKDKLGEVYDGFLSGIAPYGMFVELKDFFVEGLIPLKYMDDDHYVYHDRRHFFKGKRTGKVYRLGDPVKVQVVRVDRDKREIDFLLVGDEATEESASRSGRNDTFLTRRSQRRRKA
jgi:ribonuclease R